MVMRRVRKIRIPVHRLEVRTVIPFTLLDERDQVLLFRGQTVTKAFLERLRRRAMTTVVAEEYLPEHEHLIE